MTIKTTTCLHGVTKFSVSREPRKLDEDCYTLELYVYQDDECTEITLFADSLDAFGTYRKETT